MADVESLLDIVADYADRLADSDRFADTGSMATAAVLEELYQSGEWVAEWLEQKPIRERTAYIGGRPPQPDSRNRFAQWLVWKEAQRQRRALRSAQTYRLLNAHEVAGYLSSGEITSEFVLRPLDWLRKNRTPDRIPEVWKRAIDLAGAEHLVTSAHTRQALADWKRDVLGTQGIREVIRTSRAQTHRLKAMSAVETFLLDGDATEWRRAGRGPRCVPGTRPRGSCRAWPRAGMDPGDGRRGRRWACSCKSPPRQIGLEARGVLMPVDDRPHPKPPPLKPLPPKPAPPPKPK